MIRRYRRRLATTCAALVALSVSGCATAKSTDRGPFTLSYQAGGRDAAGQFAGGTELRVLAGHGGRLYAGNGYWKDRPGAEGRQGPQVLVLDAPGAPWRVDHAFDDRFPGGRLRDLAVGALAEAVFSTGGDGAPLPRPVSLLLASTWDLSGTSRIFTRDDGTGTWTAVTLAQDQPAADFLPQVRSFGTHRDQVTGADMVFAGQMPRGVFAGRYDAGAPGRVRWDAEPEPGIASVAPASPGLEGRLRVSSFAEANGRLYAAIGQKVFERQDGPAPRWRPMYTNPHPGRSETGLRGLTAVPAPNGGQALLAAVEGSAARLVRIDPRTGAEATELELAPFLRERWGMPVGYVIAAYNDMTPVATAGSGPALLIGLMAFVPRGTVAPAGHRLLDVGYGLVEGGAWFLVRSPDGQYGLHEVTAAFPHLPVAVRTSAMSPFPGDRTTVYLGGFDANKAVAHNTAWVVRWTVPGVLSKALP